MFFEPKVRAGTKRKEKPWAIVPLPAWEPTRHARDLYGLVPTREVALRLGPNGTRCWTLSRGPGA